MKKMGLTYYAIWSTVNSLRQVESEQSDTQSYATDKNMPRSSLEPLPPSTRIEERAGEESKQAPNPMAREMANCLMLRDWAEELRESYPELAEEYRQMFLKEHRRIAHKIRWGGREPSLIEWLASFQGPKRSERPKSEIESLLQEKRQEFYRLIDQSNSKLMSQVNSMTIQRMKAKLDRQASRLSSARHSILKPTVPSETWKSVQRDTVILKLIKTNLPIAYVEIWLILAEPFIQRGMPGLNSLKAAMNKEKRPGGLLEALTTKADRSSAYAWTRLFPPSSQDPKIWNLPKAPNEDSWKI